MRWIRYILSLLALQFVCMTNFSQTMEVSPVGTFSEYKDGTFHTSCVMEINAPYHVVKSVYLSIVEGMKTSPTKDLDWAFQNMSKTTGSREEFLLREEGVVYNPQSNKYQLKLKIGLKDHEPGLYTINANLKTHTYPNGKYEISFRTTQKIKIMNTCGIILHLMQKDANTSVVCLHSDMSFSWLFNIFFTEKRYKNVLEWRLEQFLLNVKNRSESHHKMVKTVNTL